MNEQLQISIDAILAQKNNITYREMLSSIEQDGIYLF
jgi:hypothetical protein